MVARTTRPIYFTLQSAAEYIDVTERTMRRYIAEGRVPAYRLGSRQIRIKVADVENLFHLIPTVKAG